MRLKEIIRNSPEASLERILHAREERVCRQNQMRINNNCPLVCITLNIPGAHKSHVLAKEAFRIAEETMLSRITASKMQVTEIHHSAGCTGYEGIYAVEGKAAQLKNKVTLLKFRIG